MKGILQKNEYGVWVVKYRETTPLSITTERLPLHPDFIEAMDTCFTSKFIQEVEFEIVHLSTDPLGRDVKPYAKLVDKLGNEDVPKLGYDNQVPDVRKMVKDVEEIERLAELNGSPDSSGFYDYKEGFVDGYLEAKSTLYTEEQVREAMKCTVLSTKAKERVIQSLKQPK